MIFRTRVHALSWTDINAAARTSDPSKPRRDEEGFLKMCLKLKNEWSDNLAMKDHYLYYMIAARHDDSSPSGLSDAARMRWRISREKLSTETATSNDGTSLTCSAWLNLSPPSPFPVYWEPSKRCRLIGWHSPSVLPPPLAHPLHVIIFLFNNQPWKRVGRKTSKYSPSHDSTRHQCTAKLSETSLQGGGDWWGLQQLTAWIRKTETLWSKASSPLLPSTKVFIHRKIEDLCI